MCGSYGAHFDLCRSHLTIYGSIVQWTHMGLERVWVPRGPIVGPPLNLSCASRDQTYACPTNCVGPMGPTLTYVGPIVPPNNLRVPLYSGPHMELTWTCVGLMWAIVERNPTVEDLQAMPTWTCVWIMWAIVDLRRVIQRSRICKWCGVMW
jgi:hypothetical protein